MREFPDPYQIEISRPVIRSTLTVSDSKTVKMRAKLIAVICLLAPLIAANPAQEAPPPPAPEYTGRNVPMPYSKRGTILNELHDPFPCRDVSLIYARTCHAPGNVGSTDKWFDALARRIGYQNLAVNGVEFPAGLGSCLEGDPIIAIHSFRRLMKLTRERCNATGVVLAGDELGADYLLEYAKTLTREDWSHVRACKSSLVWLDFSLRLS